jgi:hypothetical protein
VALRFFPLVGAWSSLSSICGSAKINSVELYLHSPLHLGQKSNLHYHDHVNIASALLVDWCWIEMIMTDLSCSSARRSVSSFFFF